MPRQSIDRKGGSDKERDNQDTHDCHRIPSREHAEQDSRDSGRQEVEKAAENRDMRPQDPEQEKTFSREFR